MKIAILALLPLALCLRASGLDFGHAAIVLPADATTPQKKAASMLKEEIESRTRLRLPIVSKWDGKSAAFVLGRAEAVKKLVPGLVDGLSTEGRPEGFALVSSTGEPAVAVVAGNDDRGVVFGTGLLLRRLKMGRNQLELSSDLKIVTSPRMSVRGHQLGYRPKTNSYDAWSVPLWEQYIRELAVFGTNTIELMPPQTDDDEDSPHFPLSQMDMMVEMSRICSEYDLSVSIWYPAMAKDYSDPKTVEAALKEWGEVFRKLPRIDAVFVPGGDPGHTQPKYMMALLEKQTENLHRYHPKAEMWVSPQGFDKAWMDEFYGLIRQEPKWLSGVVYGPQNRDRLAEFRRNVPKRYPIRYYPDITHSYHSQFSVPNWDAAYAQTEGREVINPRPLGEATIFRAYQSSFDGFVTYSEGCNDDVNKIVWSMLGWNPDEKVDDIVREYSRFFIGADLEESFAQGLLGLERNWKGSLSANAGVEATAEQFEAIEKKATPKQKLSWRFQQALYRAYYDAYLRSRLLSENQQEERALRVLRGAAGNGSLAAMKKAEEVLDADVLTETARRFRARVFELAEALFQSIRMQLSVDRYQAVAIRRGANLDAVDFPLNNKVWLKHRFQEIRAMADEKERLKKVDAILNWTNPGPGGFYDDLGNIEQQPHLVWGEPYEKDPEFRQSVLMGFGSTVPKEGARVSSFSAAATMFDEPLRMRYTGLSANGRYKARVVYSDDGANIPIRLVANGVTEIHPYREKDPQLRPVEFDIPQEATRSGQLTLEWTRKQGMGGSGRGNQVSEVWLIRTEEGQR